MFFTMNPFFWRGRGGDWWVVRVCDFFYKKSKSLKKNFFLGGGGGGGVLGGRGLE